MAHSGSPLREELRRGFNPYSLTLSAVVAAFAAAGLWLAGFGNTPSAAAGLALFAAIAGLHGAMHAWFGARLESGLRAEISGQSDRAEQLLRVFDHAGARHYDARGLAAAALARLRAQAAGRQSRPRDS